MSEVRNRAVVRLGNFETILSIAFGINAGFYLFSILPFTAQAIESLMKYAEQVRKDALKAGVPEGEIYFPLSFVIGASFHGRKLIVNFISILLSAVSLGILLYIAFVPDRQIGGALMLLIVAILLLPVPLLAFWHHRWYRKLILGYVQQIDLATSRLREKKSAEAQPRKHPVEAHNTVGRADV